MYFVHPGSEASALVLGGQLRMLNRQPFALLEPGNLIPKLHCPVGSIYVNLKPVALLCLVDVDSSERAKELDV